MALNKEHIIFEDTDIIVVYKKAGMATQSASLIQLDMVSELKNYLSNGKNEPYLGLIHRLDQPVEGLLVFAKNKKSAAVLSAQIARKQFHKNYLAAVIFKENAKEEDHFCDFLKKDKQKNCAIVCKENEQDAKRAILDYKKIKNIGDEQAIIKVNLQTGRFHQIRCQLAAHGMPILGDRKYYFNTAANQTNITQLALCAYQLTFQHPSTGEEKIFEIEPQNNIFRI